MKTYNVLHDRTPLMESIPLSALSRKKILIKMECNQRAGSFKIRGLGRLCQYYHSIGKQHFISSSGGNAGYAVAYAGKKLGIPVTVFIPSTSKPVYVNAIRSLDVPVNIAGDTWDDANQAAQAYCEQVDGAYIPPFDHPIIWEGHATIIDEVVEQGPKPDAVVVAVGGGGLACGILQGLHHYGWFDIPVFTVEPEGAASFATSVSAGKVVTLPRIDTIATSLGARRITPRLLEWSQQHPVIPLVISDTSAIHACRSFLDDHRILTDPACGAALSVIYDQRPELSAYQTILVIACGGIGMTLKLLEEYLKNA